MGKRLSLTLIILGTLFLMIAQIALWARWQILSPQRFSHHAAEIFQEETVRLALAQVLVAQALKERPLLLKATQKPATAAISGILGTPAFSDTFEKTAALLFQAVTEDYSEGISINVEPAHKYLAAIAALAERDIDREISPEKWPTEIVIIEAGQFPPLHKIPLGLTWIAVLGFILAAALYLWVFLKSTDRKQVLKILGITLMVFSGPLILALLSLPSMVAGSLPGALGQVVVGELLQSFTQSLMWQTELIFLVGLGLLIIKIYSSRKS